MILRRAARTRGTGNRLGIVTAAFAILFAVAYVVVPHIRSRDEPLVATSTAKSVQQRPPLVAVIKVEIVPSDQTLTLPGDVRGWHTSTINARVSGYVAKWIVDIGDRVTKGQVMATLDTPELDSQLEAAQHYLAVGEAEVGVREADVDFTKTTYDRWQGSPKGVVSEQERQDKKAQYAVAVAQLNAARARVSQDKSNVDRLTFIAGFKQVAAPYDGVVTERHVDVGDLVTNGGTLLYRMAQYDKVRVFANVAQVESGKIGTGSFVRVTASEYPDRVFEGKVTRTSESIDLRARTLRVEIDIQNKDLALLPGMYVQAEFALKPANIVQVPASAMLFRTGGPQVAVVDATGTARFKDVTIGRDNGNFVEIASGLAEGDRVVLNINSQIADGDQVTVRDDKTDGQ
jgi:RND family efflux transporter MFP subunit